jgi:hypothetical protein
LDAGGRCRPNGWNIELGARSIPAAGVRSTAALRATRLWPAWLHYTEPAGLHRVSVSARIRSPLARVRRSSARIWCPGLSQLHHSRPGGRCGGRQSGRRGSGRRSCERRHRRDHRRHHTATFRCTSPAGLWRLSATRLRCNPSAKLRWLPPEVGSVPSDQCGPARVGKAHAALIQGRAVRSTPWGSDRAERKRGES